MLVKDYIQKHLRAVRLYFFDHLSHRFFVVVAFCIIPTLFPSVLPDGCLSGDGFVLLLDVELGRLHAQVFLALHLLDAAIA